MEDKRCISCKKKIDNLKGSIIINCPECSKYEIVRCQSCRKNAVKYKCPSCNFEGPN